MLPNYAKQRRYLAEMNVFKIPPIGFALTRRFVSSLLLLAALASASPGFCGPIHDAVRAGELNKVEVLLKDQPNLVSSKDEKLGQTPLHIAAFGGRIDIAKLLLANKADVNAKANNGATPLHLAAAKGDKDMVELLVASKAEVNAVDNDGWSPLHSAVVWDHKDVEELLRQHGGEDLPAPKHPAKPSAPAEKTPPKETTKDGSFVAYDDGTVLDTKTNLMWMARDNGAALSWPAAKTYAENFRGGGYADWRLPTLSELTGLYDKTKTYKSYCPTAVNELGELMNEVHVTELIRLSCTREWTSQERSDKPGSVTIFDFHSGNDAARPGSQEFVDTASRVLLVRTVKP
jgi:Protein of unknown function (DUF1566)/Ankyrin repeats (3 copies)/Ankyrin repeats (many copies)